MDNTQILFIENLKRLRNRHRLTQSKAAEGIGISLSGYTQIEYGKVWPTPQTISNIAKLYKCLPSDLFEEAKSTPKNLKNTELIGEIVTLLPSLNEAELGLLLDMAQTSISLRSRKSGSSTGS